MIRRPAQDSFLLIPQQEHALLAGQLARRLGNTAFAAPSPYGPTIEAIDFHDCGWPAHDDRPTLNKKGLPLHVFEAPFRLSIGLWADAVDRVIPRGVYQGLLVSLHVLNLSSISLSHMANPSRADLFEINKFQHRQIEIQEKLRGELGLCQDQPLTLGLAAPEASPADDLLLFSFRLLTAMDRLSLALCCGDHLFPTIDDIIPQPGANPLSIRIDMPDPGTMVLDPWPFDVPVITVEIGARRVQNRPFSSEEAFRAAYDGAPVESIPFRLKMKTT